MSELERELKKMSQILRQDVVRMVYLAGDGHPGPALSVADLITALYFKLLRIDPKNPSWDDRDRFILSKGHACPVLYAALSRRGFFPTSELPGLRSIDSMLQGHPDMNKTPGIDMTSGSLGNGIAIGIGMALSARHKEQNYMTYVITGDGELEEGVIWESVMAAKHLKLGKLLVIIDNNGFQSGGKVSDISGIEPIMPKWEAFGWHCQEIDGHDFKQILQSIDSAKKVDDTPSMILAHTVKGQGVPFMIGDNTWHKRVPTKKEFEEAIQILGGEL